ncbi:MAG TPA: mechanosensitive ion channel domain-containing protein [Stellaceae bacterium]|nr:mechanosensitive ion channel domain-containing protein [Stellaceae bacterium]
MRLRFGWGVAVVATLALGIGGIDCAGAANAPAAPHLAGWLELTSGRIETEILADIAAAPEVPGALDREWRSFDAHGSALGALAGFGWVVLATLVALIAEWAVARLLGRRARRRMETREAGPTLFGLVALLACDIVGLAAFLAVFAAARRHALPGLGVSEALAIFAANVLLRWRIVSLIIRAILRPSDPVARLIDIPDREARRLRRFLSGVILAIILLVGFGRYGLMGESSGAPHVIGLINAVLVCALYVLIVFRARDATEALIRGRRSGGMIATMRAGLARAWLAVALILVAGLLVFFIAGLSLGMLSYYRAVTSTLGILLVTMVLDRLTERVWDDSAPIATGTAGGIARLQSRARHRIVRAICLVVAAMALVWIWTQAIEMAAPDVAAVMRSSGAAVGTLFVAFVAWELVRLAIDRHLHTTMGPALPGADIEDETAAPASRLETILPLMRAAFGVTIAVLAVLIVLSRLGVDTAPLIAGAGVFGLAVSFGSQSLIRDIISGLFYMWDDAFRVGEYIDTGRLKGTVETLGIRSVKLRHQNGPLHTIPYGQLGAVSNLSRDFATIKFNLRLDPRTDIELVRKTTKQIGLAMQEDTPELAAEIMLPLKLQGIAEVADNALVLRFKFTARPVKPSWVQREYLKRIYTVFPEKGIAFASGAVFLQTLPPLAAEPALPEPAPSPPAPATTTVGMAAGREMAAMAETAPGTAA